MGTPGGQLAAPPGCLGGKLAACQAGWLAFDDLPVGFGTSLEAVVQKFDIKRHEVAGGQALQPAEPRGAAVQHLLLVAGKEGVQAGRECLLLSRAPLLLRRQPQPAGAAARRALPQQPEGEGGEAGGYLWARRAGGKQRRGAQRHQQ